MHKLAVPIIAVMLLSSCQKRSARKSPAEGYTISGNIIGIDSAYIELREEGFRDRSIIKVIDSTKIINGTFEFKGKVDYPDMVSLRVKSKFSVRFMIENAPIEINIDLTQRRAKSPFFAFDVLGSETNDKYQKADADSKAVFDDPHYQQLDTMNALLSKAKEDTSYLAQAQKLKEELAPLRKERAERFKNKKYDFVRNNPSSPAAVYILGYFYSHVAMSDAELREFHDIFEGDARETNFFKSYISSTYQDHFENLTIGSTAPDFTLNDLEGQPITLSKVEATYKLVDFWASWCAPCRAEFPHLKELRKKYLQSGFEILAVGSSDAEDRWRKAIKEDQTPWLHVFDLKPDDTGKVTTKKGEVSTQYAVSHLPTTFLMDSNEKIILRNPSKEELDAKLIELFGF